jgi:Uma2 family endonuclease
VLDILPRGAALVAQPKNTNYTVEEYLKLDCESTDARYEYYDGTIRMMSGGSSPHGLISMNVGTALNIALGDSPCGVLGSEIYLQLNATRYAHPDVTVSCDAEDLQGNMVHFPVIIFEVLSPTTESFDRGRKALYYRAIPSLREYVLIEQDQISVEVQRRHNDTNLWAIDNYGEGDTITLASLGISLAVNDFYRKVVFPDATESQP